VKPGKKRTAGFSLITQSWALEGRTHINTAVLMSLGFSLTDIAEISKFALNLYQSCEFFICMNCLFQGSLPLGKNAGTEFKAVSNDGISNVSNTYRVILMTGMHSQ
jgi:hypothetical protein